MPAAPGYHLAGLLIRAAVGAPTFTTPWRRRARTSGSAEQWGACVRWDCPLIPGVGPAEMSISHTRRVVAYPARASHEQPMDASAHGYPQGPHVERSSSALQGSMVPSGHEGGACRRSAGRSAPRHWSHVGGGQHGVLNAHGRVGSSSLLPKHTRRVHAGSVPCSGRAVVGEVEGHPSDPEPVRWYWSTAPFIPHSQWVSSCTRSLCARG